MRVGKPSATIDAYKIGAARVGRAVCEVSKYHTARKQAMNAWLG